MAPHQRYAAATHATWRIDQIPGYGIFTVKHDGA